MKFLMAVILAPGAWIVASSVCYILALLGGHPGLAAHTIVAALLFLWMWRICND